LHLLFPQLSWGIDTVSFNSVHDKKVTEDGQHGFSSSGWFSNILQAVSYKESTASSGSLVMMFASFIRVSAAIKDHLLVLDAPMIAFYLSVKKDL
jgi:3-dehydroquinate dehydratase